MPAVQTTFGDASLVGTFPADVTVGNTIAVTVAQRSGNNGIPLSVTDSLGNTYTLLQAATHATEEQDFAASIWSAPVTVGGPCTITVQGAQVDLVVESMLFATNQRWTAEELPGEAVYEQGAIGLGPWEDGSFPNAGPTADLTSANNHAIAVTLAMKYGGGATGLDVPAGWTELGLYPEALDPGSSHVSRDIASIDGPSLVWDYVRGSGAFWMAALAVFRMPDAGPEPQPVAPGEVASGDAFGAIMVGRGAAPAAAPGGIVSLESFGSLVAGRGPAPAIAAGEFASTTSFGDLVVGRGAAPAIAPGAVEGAARFGLFSIATSVEVAPGSVGPTSSFGSFTVGRGPAPAVSPGAIASSDSFGALGGFALDPDFRPSLAQLVVVEAPSRVLELPAPDRILVADAPDRIIVIPGDPP